MRSQRTVQTAFSIAILSFIPQLLSAPAVELPLTLPGQPGTQGELPGRGASTCYNLTLSDEAVREIVWWEQRRLSLRLEPCVGRPHLRASIYGCPSDGAPVVWEYMSPKMQADLTSRGETVPADWEWIGDVESLVIDITHKTYYIEVVHHAEPYKAVDGQDTFARFRLEAHVLDLAHMPMESINPLKHVCGWDKEIRVRGRVTQDRSVFRGFRVALEEDATKTVIEWFEPGQGGPAVVEGACPWSANISGNFSYQVYLREITDEVGTSGVDYDNNEAAGITQSWVHPGGDFTDIVKPPVCPPVKPDGSGECTSSTCRVCPLRHPECPKEFLTNCSEVAVNLDKIRPVIQNSLRPLEAYMKNSERYTLWTSCGLVYTANRLSAKRIQEKRPPDKDGGWASVPESLNPEGAAGKWWSAADADLLRDGPAGTVALKLEGLIEDRNNVYLINVVARDEETGETAPYNLLTLQYKTAKYVPPKLEGPDVALLVGIGAALGFLVLAFVIAAIFVHRRRMQRRAQKPKNANGGGGRVRAFAAD